MSHPENLDVLYTWNYEQEGFFESAISNDGSLAAMEVEGEGDSIYEVNDHRIKVWSMETMQELYDFTGHHRPVGALTFTPDNRRLISGSEDLTIRVWELTP